MITVPGRILDSPQVFYGKGTPIFIALLVLLLAGYATATWLLTRAGAPVAGPALVCGVIAAALWTVGRPAGGTSAQSS